jgi:geranylgeranyl diphosphate synthase type II
MDIKSYLAEQRLLVEDGLEKYMLATADRLADHIEAMRYSLFAGGKRVRPILCLAATAAVHGREEATLPTACALECIHTYSLIHDDLPAMDNDDYRRGKLTNHKLYGEAQAILAGDGLLTFAFELMSNPEPHNIPDRQRLRVINLVARAAGSLGMVGGQALDIACEGKEISFGALHFIHSRKTGALITAAVQAGAILGGAEPDRLEALTEYGEKIGLTFQIVDDLLNVEGSLEQLGKAAGSDAARRKATYPAFFGAEETRKKANETAAAAIDCLRDFDQLADPLREIARYIVDRQL